MRAIGVDIGGTTIKIAVVSCESGKVERESSIRTPRTTARNIAFIVAERVDEMIATDSTIDRLGVGVPGAMDRERRLVRYPPNLPGWQEEPLAEYLKEALPHFSR